VSSARHDWEARHGASQSSERAPSAFLVEQVASLPPGRALDIACGAGRHALFLARRGWAVDAIDFARTGLQGVVATTRREQLPIHVVQADLEAFPLPVGRYDLLVNVRYLQRTLFEAMRAAVRPGGVVLFETFLRDQEQLGHPRNPDFLLNPGELAQRFRDFALLAYAEGRFETESGPAYLARMLARRGSIEFSECL
jgi:SAM-dependent methyltransferase